MPLTKEEEKEVRRVLLSGMMNLDKLEPFFSKVEPELAAALPDGHGLDAHGMRRFLIARNLVVDGPNGAKDMVLRNIEWRQATLPVTMTEALKEELAKGKFFVAGKDVEGNALIVARSSRFDPKVRDLNVAINAAVHTVEESLASLPDSKSTFSLLYDRTDFSFFRNWDLPFLKGVVTLFSNNYPERLHAAYIYPCGGMLNALWKIVSVFIDPRTQAKVKMIHDPKDLVDCVPKEHLPQHLGGEAPERS